MEHHYVGMNVEKTGMCLRLVLWLDTDVHKDSPLPPPSVM